MWKYFININFFFNFYQVGCYSFNNSRDSGGNASTFDKST